MQGKNRGNTCGAYFPTPSSRPLETFEGIFVHLLRCQNLWLLQLLGLPRYPSSASLAFYTSGFILIAPLASLASLARSMRSPCQVDHKEHPRGLQDTSRAPARVPKTRPRGLQTSPDIQKNPVFPLFFHCFYVPRVSVNILAIPCTHCFPRHLQDVQKSLKTLPRTPKTSPRDYHMPPRHPTRQPRRLQEVSRHTARFPKNLIFPLIFH